MDDFAELRQTRWLATRADQFEAVAAPAAPGERLAVYSYDADGSLTAVEYVSGATRVSQYMTPLRGRAVAGGAVVVEYEDGVFLLVTAGVPVWLKRREA